VSSNGLEIVIKNEMKLWSGVSGLVEPVKQVDWQSKVMHERRLHSGWVVWSLVWQLVECSARKFACHYSMQFPPHAATSTGRYVYSGSSTKCLRCCWHEIVYQTGCSQVLGTGPTSHAMCKYDAMQLVKLAAALSTTTPIHLTLWCFWTAWEGVAIP